MALCSSSVAHLLGCCFQVSLFKKQKQRVGGVHDVHTEAPVHRERPSVRTASAQLHLVSAVGCRRVSLPCVFGGLHVCFSCSALHDFCVETELGPLFSCFRGKLTVFTVLCEQYQPSLRRDPMYNEVRGWGSSRRAREVLRPRAALGNGTGTGRAPKGAWGEVLRMGRVLAPR